MLCLACLAPPPAMPFAARIDTSQAQRTQTGTPPPRCAKPPPLLFTAFNARTNSLATSARALCLTPTASRASVLASSSPPSPTVSLPAGKPSRRRKRSRSSAAWKPSSTPAAATCSASLVRSLFPLCVLCCALVVTLLPSIRSRGVA